MVQVGYIGVGNMGSALAARLQLTYPLVVFDAVESAVHKMVARGARGASTPRDIAAECDVIFLCLPTSSHVRQVILGDRDFHEVLKPGTLLIDQSTGNPADTRGMSVQLAARGIDLIDAPVSGGRSGADAGTIAIMIGASDANYHRALPFVQAISPNIFHAGGVGNGHVIKLVNNLTSAVQRALSFEAITLAAKCGVEPKIATEILLASGGRNAYLEKMMKPRILEGKLNVGFTLGLAHKDVRLACQMGAEAGVPMLLGNVGREIYQICMSEMGVEGQVDTIGLFYDRIAGTSVVPPNHDLT